MTWTLHAHQSGILHLERHWYFEVKNSEVNMQGSAMRDWRQAFYTSRAEGQANEMQIGECLEATSLWEDTT